MPLIRHLFCLLALIAMTGSGVAQDASAPDRSSTGGAPTLADIMARQAQQSVDDTERRIHHHVTEMAEYRG